MARNGSARFLNCRTYFAFVIAVVFCSFLVIHAETPPSDSSDILNHLNAAIRWYRQVEGVDVAAGQPSDVLYLQNARNLSHQVLQAAFQSSEAEAAVRRSQKEGGAPANTDTASPDVSQQNISKAAAETADRIQQAQLQIDDLNHRIEKAPGKKRQELISQRAALQGELELDHALAEALGKIQTFVTTSENTNSGLFGKINDLKRSVPELAATAANDSKPASNGQTTKSTHADSSGLIGQAAVLFSQMGDVHDIDQLIAETSRLHDTADHLQAPLRDDLRTTLQQGRAAASQPPTSDPAQAQQIRRDLARLTARFKLLSNAAVPLRQEMILLDECKANLAEWRRSVVKEYTHVLRSLLTRIAIILGSLGILAILSALWRRATLRYIHDSRRRRQVLLVRRFVTGFLMIVVVVLGFISEFSSLATFAGFLTAGLAVALQTVILSIAAYFFLIGRYGVRVGDRITVAGVTGDVIDVGLVRLYLMELAGTGIDLYPTGRAVVFSNSVLFQAAPLFKQIPGTAYAWHEVAISLAAEADPTRMEKLLLEAVQSVYREYEPSILRQHRAVEQLLDVPLPPPEPHSQLRFGENGLEFVVRYPVEIQRASDIDDQVTRKLFDTIGRTPEMKKAVAGSPRLRSAIRA